MAAAPTHTLACRQTPERPHPCYLRRRVGAGVRSGSGSDGGAGAGLSAAAAAAPAAAGKEEVVLDVNELAAVHGDGISVGQVGVGQRGHPPPCPTFQACRPPCPTRLSRSLTEHTPHPRHGAGVSCVPTLHAWL